MTETIENTRMNREKQLKELHIKEDIEIKARAKPVPGRFDVDFVPPVNVTIATDKPILRPKSAESGKRIDIIQTLDTIIRSENR